MTCHYDIKLWRWKALVGWHSQWKAVGWINRHFPALQFPQLQNQRSQHWVIFTQNVFIDWSEVN